MYRYVTLSYTIYLTCGLSILRAKQFLLACDKAAVWVAICWRSSFQNAGDNMVYINIFKMLMHPKISSFIYFLWFFSVHVPDNILFKYC